MNAKVGDRLVIKGHHVGEPDRDAEILEVHGDDGGPPYLVRWDDDGHEGLFFPGSDAVVEHLPAAQASALNADLAMALDTAPARSGGSDEAVEIELRGFGLPGRLTVPPTPLGVVLFGNDAGASSATGIAHVVARRLVASGIGALRFDLMAQHEHAAVDAEHQLDVLAVRLIVATRWLRAQERLHGCRVGYFGIGTSAVVAMLAAVEDPTVTAVVTRAGQFDLMTEYAGRVNAPTLLILGHDDASVRQPDGDEATDLIAEVAGTWFLRHLDSTPAIGSDVQREGRA